MLFVFTRESAKFIQTSIANLVFKDSLKKTYYKLSRISLVDYKTEMNKQAT